MPVNGEPVFLRLSNHGLGGQWGSVMPTSKTHSRHRLAFPPASIRSLNHNHCRISSFRIPSGFRAIFFPARINAKQTHDQAELFGRDRAP